MSLYFEAIVMNKTKDTHDLNTLAGWKQLADENGTIKNIPVYDI